VSSWTVVIIIAIITSITITISIIVLIRRFVHCDPMISQPHWFGSARFHPVSCICGGLEKMKRVVVDSEDEDFSSLFYDTNILYFAAILIRFLARYLFFFFVPSFCVFLCLFVQLRFPGRTHRKGL
jgi:hypothetical protein